jgi:hypothetical protein
MRLLPLPVLLAALMLVQCGGTAATPEPQAADRERESSGQPEEQGDDEGEAGNEANGASSEPAGPNCDDGTCSKCGSGICPSGWYCDENASGGPACSWLKECADKPSCSCVTRVLGAACKCREEAGGLKVACN